MSTHTPKHLFLPIPLALKDCLTNPSKEIPLFLSKILNIDESTTHEELCHIEVDEKTSSTLDPNSISAINDLCLNIISSKWIMNSKNKLIDSNNLLEISVDILGFKGPGSIKSLKDAGISTSLDLSKMTFSQLSHLKNFSKRNLYTAAFLLEKYCLTKRETQISNIEQTLSSIDHEEILSMVSSLENINSIPLSDPRIFSEKQYEYLISLIYPATALSIEQAYLSDLVELYDESVEQKVRSELIVFIEQAVIAIKNIDNLAIEEQVLDPFYSLTPPGKNRLISKRLGLHGDDPLTLEKTAKFFDPIVTRERVRQIEAKFFNKVDNNHKKFYIPKFDELILSLKNKVPISENKLLENFNELDQHPFTLKSIKSISETYRKDFPFVIKVQRGVRFLLTDEDEGFKLILNHAHKFCGRTGFVNTTDLSDYLELVHDYKVTDEKIKEVLEDSSFVQLSENWFMEKDLPDGRNRFLNVCLSMFFCVNPLNPKDIREGLRRTFSWRSYLQKEWSWMVAPTEVIKKSFEHLDGYTITENGEIKASSEQIEKYEPNDSIITLKEIINDTPNQIIHTREFYKVAKSKGMNPASFFSYCSYQPYIERFDNGIWGLRGSKPSAEDISNLRDYLKDIPPKRNKLLESFNEQGEIEVVIRITTVTHMVLQVSNSFNDYLGNSDYIMKSVSGIEYGGIRPTEDGRTYVGAPKALTRLGVEDGDYVKFTFNITNKVVVLEPVPASIIWELE